ncbi:hypothetical protein T12_16457 [Trichinella patagoniensis]|uniref:Uncharacterized protein n=1 Tax=Trichinella patagoniensis TaxID=990121 RepID=A0A0V0YV18_9BILA|nr:hypothetical protein T12_16457 [Trichinella patagoniensis]
MSTADSSDKLRFSLQLNEICALNAFPFVRKYSDD